MIFNDSTNLGVRRLRILMLACALPLSACASLPSNGPTAGELAKEVRSSRNVLGMQIIDIVPAMIDQQTAPSPSATTLATLATDGRVDVIGPGDILAIQLYEVGVSLFGRPVVSATPDGIMPPPTATGLQIGSGFTVAADGTITVPYVGRLHVAGLTTSQVQDAIVRGLRGKSQSPQAVVTVQQNQTNTIMISGVPRPGRQGLGPARQRLLDAIGDAGGVSAQDNVVRFTRGERTIEQPLDQIEVNSADNLMLLPGDRIEIIRQVRSFVVFGATDRISQVNFDARSLSLAEAIARIGGPSDARANPRSVFVFRYADGPPILDGKSGAVQTPTGRPLIYRLNMMSATSYFLAQKFAMRDKDVIYVSNSPTNQGMKLAQIVNLLTSPAYLIRALTE